MPIIKSPLSLGGSGKFASFERTLFQENFNQKNGTLLGSKEPYLSVI